MNTIRNPALLKKRDTFWIDYALNREKFIVHHVIDDTVFAFKSNWLKGSYVPFTFEDLISRRMQKDLPISKFKYFFS